VDDSAVMRGIMRSLFKAYAEIASEGKVPIELCGVAEDGIECLAAVQHTRPDVVVLDLEMPRMNGLAVLERLHIEEPGLPVIMCSSYTERGARSTLDALARGASDYVMKPGSQRDFASAVELLSSQILPKIAALAVSGAARSLIPQRISHLAGRSAPASEPTGARVEIVVIGVSTGGPSALEQVLPELQQTFPVPILIVQHMPKLFTGALAERLNRLCALDVREASDGVALAPGTIWLAPGDAHMEVSTGTSSQASGQMLRTPRTSIKLHQQVALNHCKPSVDYLFSSAARIYGAGTLALVMTGMGSDGLNGARSVHEAGGTVLTQDQATSAVWGMPGRVAQAGLGGEPLPLGVLAAELRVRTQFGRRPAIAAVPESKPATPRHHADRGSDSKVEVMHGLL
jgi:two-component system, chemotaxis family, protein-glutamate methylesterase/glutaminase